MITRNVIKQASSGCKNIFKSNLAKTILKFLLGRVGLFFILMLYVALGALLFISIESATDDKTFEDRKLALDQIVEARTYIIDYLWKRDTSADPGGLGYKHKTKGLLNLYAKFIVHKAQEVGYDASDESEWSRSWTYPNALLFTVTTVAAIGYGHIFPQTTKGQIVCLFYGMVGVPFLLLFLAIIGDYLAAAFTYIYSRLCCRWCRVYRYITIERQLPKERDTVWEEKVGEEEYMPTDEVTVPVVVILTILTLYLLFGGAVFSMWEGWTLVESIYFCFVTLTTIGFGDYVPGNNSENATNAILILLINSVYCMFGMALITMCISLMQLQFEEKMSALGSLCGFNSNDEPIQPIPKKSDRAKLKITPPGKGGNQLMRSWKNRPKKHVQDGLSEPLLVNDDIFISKGDVEVQEFL